MTRAAFSRAFCLALLLMAPAGAPLAADGTGGTETNGRTVSAAPRPAFALLPCRLHQGHMDSCARIVACVSPPTMVFVGRGFGWNHGTITGDLDGVPCTGSWVSRNVLGLGQAEIRCENGLTGTVFFTYQDSLTGTATGRGMTNRGQMIRVWSGNNIRAFLSHETGRPDARLMCGEREIPIS